MKKKIVSVAIVAAVAVAAAWGFNQSNNEMALSDVALSNVEALASGEWATYWCCSLEGVCNVNWAEQSKDFGDFRVTPCF